MPHFMVGSNPDHPMLTAINMLENVPEGNYAVQQQEGDPFRFYRYSRPKKDLYGDKGVIVAEVIATKIQRRSSDDLKDVMLYLPTSSFVNYTQPGLEHDLFVICLDWRDAARTFAKELGKCARCGKSLTDVRSRWLLIGPECEQHWPTWVADHEEREGISFEEAFHSGLVAG